MGKLFSLLIGIGIFGIGCMAFGYETVAWGLTIPMVLIVLAIGLKKKPRGVQSK